MIVTLDYMDVLFEECNREYFGGVLPVPAFEILHSTRTCGYFRYQEDWSGTPVISLTDSYDMTKAQMRDIMCHEMIHYYLAYTGEDKNCRHGRKFKRMAAELNEQYGLHITKIVDTSVMRRNPKSHFWQRKLLSQPIQPASGIRFYKEYNGTVYEFSTLGQWFEILLGRLLGTVISLVIFFLLGCFFYWYGQTH